MINFQGVYQVRIHLFIVVNGSKNISLILVSLTEYTVQAREAAPLSVRLRSTVPSLCFVHVNRQVRGEGNTPSAH